MIPRAQWRAGYVGIGKYCYFDALASSWQESWVFENLFELPVPSLTAGHCEMTL
jgi:hypothetical protein